MKIAQHHFNFKTVCKKQRTAGGMPHLKPTDFGRKKLRSARFFENRVDRGFN